VEISKNPLFEHSRFSAGNIFLLSIYVLGNALFVYKYSQNFSLDSTTSSLGYIAFAILMILIIFRDYTIGMHKRTLNVAYFIFIVIAAIALLLLMLHFDPHRIAVGRYPALNDWISRLLNLDFPYISSTNPSGFPFLFFLALPFYLFGDSGLFQITAFLIFAFLISRYHKDNPANRLRLSILLIAAPIFLYEIAVRSELFSNMVIILLYLTLAEKLRQKTNLLPLMVAGIIGGFLLSTRGVIFLIYIIFFGNLLGGSIRRLFIFATAALCGFILTLVPFMAWNWSYFVDSGPFAVQLSYIPSWLLALSVAVSIFCAFRIKSLRVAYLRITAVLFGVVLVAFIISIIKYGWIESVLRDRFDISYFCFTTPFLLLSMNLSPARQSQTDQAL